MPASTHPQLESRLHALAKLRGKVPPFANGSCEPPIGNGANGEPIGNGANGAKPIGNGANGAGPIGNGANGEPIGNGVNGEPIGNGANGRDHQGRFAKGNPGGPGNPFMRQLAAFRKAICQAVSEDDLRAVARVLVDKATDGDLAAAKLLWLYTIGRPGAAADPDTLDQHEWQLFQQTPTDGEQLQAVIGSMPIEMACRLLRVARPAITEEQERQLAYALNKQERPRKQERPLTRRQERRLARKERWLAQREAAQQSE